MIGEIEELKTGVYQLYFRFRIQEVALLVQMLKNLEESGNHFHIISDFTGPSEIADVEISLMGSEEQDNLLIDGQKLRSV